MSKAKLPAFQFYPGDWRKDSGVQALGFFERGVWFEILCLMHECEDRGKLSLNGKKMPDEALARLLGLDNQKLKQTLTTLLDYGVASEEPETGILYNRRMVRDEHLRKIRAEAGKKGGNPALLKQKDNQKVNHAAKQNPTPSSSSSISSSDKEIPPSGNSNKSTPILIKTFLTNCDEQGILPVPETDPVFTYADEIQLPHEFLHICWIEFVERYLASGKKQKDWRATFRNCVRGNWYKLWWINPQGEYALSTQGMQAKKKLEAAA